MSVKALCNLSTGRSSTERITVLGGTLDIDLLNSFVPTNGEVFDLINFNGVESGQFLGVTDSDASEWTVEYNQGQVDLEFNKPVVTNGVPDSGTTLLLLAASMAATAFVGGKLRRARAA